MERRQGARERHQQRITTLTAFGVAAGRRDMLRYQMIKPGYLPERLYQYPHIRTAYRLHPKIRVLPTNVRKIELAFSASETSDRANASISTLNYATTLLATRSRVTQCVSYESAPRATRKTHTHIVGDVVAVWRYGAAVVKVLLVVDLHTSHRISSNNTCMQLTCARASQRARARQREIEALRAKEGGGERGFGGDANRSRVDRRICAHD